MQQPCMGTSCLDKNAHENQVSIDDVILSTLSLSKQVPTNFLRSFCSSMLSEAPFDWLLYEIGTQQTCSCKYVCSWSKVLPSMFENIFEKVTRQQIPFGVMSQGGSMLSRIFSQTVICDCECAHANVRCTLMALSHCTLLILVHKWPQKKQIVRKLRMLICSPIFINCGC